MGVILRHETFEAALIQVAAGSGVVGAIPLDVRVADPRQVASEILGGFGDQDEMPVVFHQAIAQELDIGVLFAVDEQLDEGVEIGWLAEDGLAIVAAVEGMVDESTNDGASGAWHDD